MMDEFVFLIWLEEHIEEMNTWYITHGKKQEDKVRPPVKMYARWVVNKYK